MVLKAKSEFGEPKLSGEMMELELSKRAHQDWEHPDFTERLGMELCTNPLSQSSPGIGFFSQDFASTLRKGEFTLSATNWSEALRPSPA